MRGQAIDRVGLHRILWDKSDRLHRIEIYQKELAQTLGITQATMSLVVKDLVEGGRIKKIAAKPRNVGVYVIYDPASFEHPFEGKPVLGFPDIERCEVCGDFFEIGPHSPKQA